MTPDHGSRRGAGLLPWLFGLAVVGAVVWVVVDRSEEQELARLLVTSEPRWLLLAVALQMATYVVDARMWQQVLRLHGQASPLRSFLALGLAKLFMDQAVPTAGVSGTLLVVSALTRRGIPRPATLACVVVDVVSYFSACALLVAGALAVVAGRGLWQVWIWLPGVGFVVGSVAVAASVVIWGRRRRALPAWVYRTPVLRGLVPVLEDVRFDMLGEPRLMLRCTGLQATIFLLDAGTLWCTLHALGVHVSPLVVISSFMLSSVARILGVVPGGLGVFEGASVAIFTLFGVAPSTGLAATLLFRGLSFWLPLVPGLVMARRLTRPAHR